MKICFSFVAPQQMFGRDMFYSEFKLLLAKVSASSSLGQCPDLMSYSPYAHVGLSHASDDIHLRTQNE